MVVAFICKNQWFMCTHKSFPLIKHILSECYMSTLVDFSQYLVSSYVNHCIVVDSRLTNIAWMLLPLSANVQCINSTPILSIWDQILYWNSKSCRVVGTFSGRIWYILNVWTSEWKLLILYTVYVGIVCDLLGVISSRCFIAGIMSL